MVPRYLHTLVLIGALLSGVPALAQSAQDQIVQTLRNQGYTRIEVSRTWLGRVRVHAESPFGEREIVFNPKTGAILRDYFEDENDDDDYDDDNHNSSSGSSSGSTSSNSGSGSNDDDDDDDRDDDDDDRDDDDDDDDSDDEDDSDDDEEDDDDEDDHDDDD